MIRSEAGALDSARDRRANLRITEATGEAITEAARTGAVVNTAAP
jgi:hypothetical protein